MRNQHCKKNCFQASNYMACNKISMHGFCLTNENLLPPPLNIKDDRVPPACLLRVLQNITSLSAAE